MGHALARWTEETEVLSSDFAAERFATRFTFLTWRHTKPIPRTCSFADWKLPPLQAHPASIGLGFQLGFSVLCWWCQGPLPDPQSSD